MKDSSVAMLRKGITRSLGGPGGDPDTYHVLAAAYMTKVLLDEGFTVDKDAMEMVQGGNAQEQDFLAAVTPDENEYY